MNRLNLITDAITVLPVELAKNQFAAFLQTRKTKRFERFLYLVALIVLMKSLKGFQSWCH